MSKLNCIIIEDEPIAAGIVRSYIEQVHFLSLVAVCGNALSALHVLKQQRVDVIFLDIHLPKLKGIDFLKSLQNPPKVIVTSAYEQYALEGFEMEVTDYLLKPFSFPRFLKAVNRLYVQRDAGLLPGATQPEYIYVNVNKKMVRISLDEILYIESMKEYVKIHLGRGYVITKFQIGVLESLLSHANFMRVHRSFVVAKSKVKAYTYDEVELVNGNQVPIGRTFLNHAKQEIHRRQIGC